ncbi:MAG TPA: glycosyltransferase family 9 protein [Alphaproteobacteria bacterium]
MPAESATILAYSDLELMGDGFMKIPFLRALRGTWPRARITWLAGKGKTVYASLLKPLVEAYLDEIIEDGGMRSDIVGILRPPLRGRRFDLVIDTQRHVRTTLVLSRVRHGKFVSGAANFWLSDIRPRGRYRKPALMIERLLDLIRVASGHDPIFAPPPTIPPEYDAAARVALPDGEIYVGLVPGAGGIHKCWPRASYVGLASHVRTLGARAVFLLGPMEQAWAEALSAAVPDARFPLQDERVSRAIAASPLFTLAIGKRLAFAVTNDCGTAHILAAAEAPLLSLFGPTNSAKMAPATPDLTIIKARDFGSDSMEAIPLGAVSAALEEMLARLSRYPAGRIGTGS